MIGLDAAPGMLSIARRQTPGVDFVEADFSRIPLPDGAVDVVTAVHALLFADDRVGALREWRRVTRPGGRLSLSVPGPNDVVPTTVFADVYDRYGITFGDDYPLPADLVGWARDAGWDDVAVDSDPTTVIPLADEVAFRAWLRVGANGRATAAWSPERARAVRPRPDGGRATRRCRAFRLPFGTIYLTARNR